MKWNTMNGALSNLKNENKEMKVELGCLEKKNSSMRSEFSLLLDRFQDYI